MADEFDVVLRPPLDERRELGRVEGHALRHPRVPRVRARAEAAVQERPVVREVRDAHVPLRRHVRLEVVQLRAAAAGVFRATPLPETARARASKS